MAAPSIHDRVETICTEFLHQLGEFVAPAGVQILVTWDEEGNTETVNIGAGNWYARIGMAREFLERDSVRTSLNMRGQEAADEGGEDDDDQENAARHD